MTTNSIEARLEYSFKGRIFSLSTTIDFDSLFEQGLEIPPLHQLLAQQHHLDPYSYQYEVMLEAAIQFENPSGYVADYLHNGVLDMDGLRDRVETERLHGMLQSIAQRTLHIDQLESQPGLKQALIEAYELGKAR